LATVSKGLRSAATAQRAAIAAAALLKLRRNVPSPEF
jgi:hypothetical protein